MQREIEDLVEELDSFLWKHGLSDTKFGILSVGDGHLMRRIRDGRPIRRSTVLKIRKWIQRFELDSA
ncbi:hypothetical protein CMI37_11220 [Candidatus Pacearchaeota archaeon]|nr:hypothetical protein [Candidatus Pacearchaeota archaeon]